MLVNPGIQVKAIEGDAFLADGNDRQRWAYVAIEHSPPDAAVGRGVAIADQARLQGGGHGGSEVG